jgi:hypothetical protein
MEMRRSYEGPEVVSQPRPQELPSPTAQYPYYGQYDSQPASQYGFPSPPPHYGYGHDKGHVGSGVNPVATPHNSSRKRWWIIGIVVLVVVVAAVGGAVGGTLGSRRKADGTRYVMFFDLRVAFRNCSSVVLMAMPRIQFADTPVALRLLLL